MPGMLSIRRRRILIAVLAVAAISLLALLVAIWLWPAPPQVHTVKLATDVEPHRVYLGVQIREKGRNHFLDLDLVTKNQGSLAALREANTPSDIKLALVPGGITAGEYANVRLVTMLKMEPLHVLLRPALLEGGLPALRGRRVNIGPATSASHHLAKAVLAFVGLIPNEAAGYQADTKSTDELLSELTAIEALAAPNRAEAISHLPDSFVFLAPLPSTLAKRIVAVAGYQLAPIPFADAFCVERMSLPTGDGIRIDRTSMGTVVIPPYTYGGNPPVPLQPCMTLAVPLLLIAQKDTDPEVVYRLLDAIHDSPLKNVIHPPPLSEQSAAFPFHDGVERFQRRHEPWLSPTVSKKLGSICGGTASFISGIVGLFTFLRVRKLRRFEGHYRELSRLQLLARGQLDEPGCPVDQKARREYLEARLSQLQSKVFSNFALGGLRGESQLADMNAMINDLRERLLGGGTLEAKSPASNQPSDASQTN